MPLTVYNSLTKQKELFQPMDPQGKSVRMYVCGPTVYDEPHVGHLRSAFTFDLMRRFMECLSYQVTFVRNVTDIDDKIIQKAREENMADLLSGVAHVSNKYLNLYHEDLKKLGILQPTHEPRATDNIPEMHALIASLLEKGFAYRSEGDVYFDVNRFAEYGKLSHQNKEAILQNVRIEKNEKKRNALDFTLWKSVKEGEPSWSSPWGPGRPGWHIECSAMSRKHLGDTFDIHGGGRDLIFPHHENEIAQSEAANGKPFARYWVHHGLMTTHEKKMSKSLKNFVTLNEISSGGASRIEDLKFLFLGTHYSAPIDYSDEKMKMEKSIRDGFIRFLAETENLRTPSMFLKKLEPIEKLENSFMQAMSDDFNTPLAVTVMHEIMTFGRWTVDPAPKIASADLLKKIFCILNLSYEEAYACLPETVQKQVLVLVEKRKEAKARKDFSGADNLRREIDALAAEYGKKMVDKKGGDYEFQPL